MTKKEKGAINAKSQTIVPVHKEASKNEKEKIKQMKHKKMKRAFRILIALAMALTAFPPMSMSGEAAGIGLTAGAPNFVANEANATTIGFGGKQWVLIGHDGKGVASSPGTLALLLKAGQGTENVRFNEHLQDGNAYGGSMLQAWMDAQFGGLSSEEQSLVRSRDLPGEENNMEIDRIAGPGVTGAKFWPLSMSEAIAVDVSLRVFDNFWWLRSQGLFANAVVSVYNTGFVNPLGRYVDFDFAARPALELDMESVLFTSAVEGGMAAGSNLSATAPPTGAVKLTVETDALTLEGITPTARGGNMIEFQYSGATPGKALSAAVLGQDGTVTYYGTLLDSTSAGGNGSATVTVPDSFTETDALYVFVEQKNDGNFTNFASGLKPLDTMDLGMGDSHGDDNQGGNLQHWAVILGVLALGILVVAALLLRKHKK